MTLLVTGHRGFVGGYAMQLSGACGLESGTGVLVDLLDLPALTKAVAATRPQAVIHLAAQSAVPDAFRDPAATYQANFIGTQNLFTALKASSFDGRVLFVSTAEVYGQQPDVELPLAETATAAPLNPYAVSKLAAEELCRYHDRVEGLDVVIARPFNHIGPGQSPRFAIADFAQAIAAIKLGQREAILKVGDLDVTRDFTDVRDVVAAYQLLLQKGERGATYNVCSGTERHMGQAVQTLARFAGVQVDVQVEQSRLRKASQRRSCGNPQKLIAHTGWRPAITWDESLNSILKDWEEKLL